MNTPIFRILAVRGALIVALSIVLGIALDSVHTSAIGWRQPETAGDVGAGETQASDDAGGADSTEHVGGNDPVGNAGDPLDEIDPPQSVTWEEAEALLEQATLVDARSAAAYRAGHVPGAVSLPFATFEHEIAGFMQRFDPDTAILIVYCDNKTCASSDTMARILISRYNYRNVLHMPGGYAEWRQKEAGGNRPDQHGGLPPALDEGDAAK